MRVMVTGATGFAGPPLVAALAASGHHVTVAIRAGRRPPAGAASVIVLPDLAQSFDATPLVEGQDAIVHLAGLAHSTVLIPEAIYRAVNCEASRRLADASRAAGLAHFVYVSSVRAQCGASAEGLVTETSAPAPTDAYGRSKLAGEAAVRAALAGSATKAVILRPVLMYGPGMKGNMMALARLSRAPWPLPLGGLKGRRSVLGIDNFAAAVLHALASARTTGATYLVADEGAVTAGEIVAAFRAGVGRKPGIVNVPLWGARRILTGVGKADLAARLFGDLVVDTAALAATGWHPVVSTREGLARAIVNS